MAGVLSVVIAPAGLLATLGLTRVARRVATVDRARGLSARSRMPEWLRAWMEHELRTADVAIGPAAALQWWGIAIAAAAVFGCALSPAVGVLAAGSVLVGAPLLLVASRGRGRRRIAAAVPAALERCAIELRAGGTVATALDALVDEGGPLAPDFALVRRRGELGASLADAITQWAEARDAPGVRAAAGALALAQSVGGACADALEGLAASLRSRLAVMAEARALAAQARLSAVVVGASPVAYLAWSAAVDPGSLHALSTTMLGRACLLAAVAMESLAVWWMRRILREEPGWS